MSKFKFMTKKVLTKKLEKAENDFQQFLWDKTCHFNSHQPRNLWGHNKTIVLSMFKKMVNDQIKEAKLLEKKEEREMYEQTKRL